MSATAWTACKQNACSLVIAASEQQQLHEQLRTPRLWQQALALQPVGKQHGTAACLQQLAQPARQTNQV